MSVQVKILYGHNYDRCKKTTISERALNELNLESLSNVVSETVGTFYQGAKTLRIQYRDDEGTFVTITNEQDVEDATNSCEPISHGDAKITRLCLRVDDVCTPVGIAESESPQTSPRRKRPRPCKASKRSLSFYPDVADEEEEIRQMYSVDAVVDHSSSLDSSSPVVQLTPYQRYSKKVEGNIKQKRSALLDIETKEHEVQRKILRVKSNPADGNMCRNCHMRLGHTARSCEYEKCCSVFRCGEEKLHPGEIDSRGTRLSIQKLKAEISKLERDRDLKEESSQKLNECLAKKVETTLMQDNVHLYMANGSKNWSLLRKHVYIIEKYCKEHFGGKIPPKHSLSDILSLALEGESTFEDKIKGKEHQTQVKSKRGNPTKSLLETRGITFPDPSSNCASTSQSATLLYRCKPITVEEEKAQLDMALRQSILESSNPSEPKQLREPSIPRLPPQMPTPFNMFHSPLFNGPMIPYFPHRNAPVFQPSSGAFHQVVDDTQSGKSTSLTSCNETSSVEIERPQFITESEITNAAMQLISLSSGQSCSADKTDQNDTTC